jgi:hypothetical protein
VGWARLLDCDLWSCAEMLVVSLVQVSIYCMRDFHMRDRCHIQDFS